MIVFARIEILFHVPVSTASVRSFPRVGHGVGQPFLQVHRVKTPSKLVESENIFLAYAGRWLIESQPRAKTAPQESKITENLKQGYLKIICGNVFVTEIAQFHDSRLGGLPNGFKVNVAIFMRNDISHTPDGAPGDTGM